MSFSQKRLLADFPAFFRVSEEVVVVIGGGEEALNKARLVAQTSARLRIIAEKTERHLADFIVEHDVEHIAENTKLQYVEGSRKYTNPYTLPAVVQFP